MKTVLHSKYENRQGESRSISGEVAEVVGMMVQGMKAGNKKGAGRFDPTPSIHQYFTQRIQHCPAPLQWVGGTLRHRRALSTHLAYNAVGVPGAQATHETARHDRLGLGLHATGSSHLPTPPTYATKDVARPSFDPQFLLSLPDPLLLALPNASLLDKQHFSIYNIGTSDASQATPCKNDTSQATPCQVFIRWSRTHLDRKAVPKRKNPLIKFWRTSASRFFKFIQLNANIAAHASYYSVVAKASQSRLNTIAATTYC